MEIKPKFGYDQLLFGMKQKDVEAIYGKPNHSFIDDDDNVIFLYNALKARLTFYAEEDFKLGYIIISNPNAILFGEKIIGKNSIESKEFLFKKGLKSFEVESFDSFSNLFNEDYWTILQTEFDEVIKVEIGAIIKNQDEFDWKF
ncbi:hypothetical protein H9X57_03245 [Flavobacterium piscinae]|uniref:Uncharacterized protein n=1 Tax=Flavobacterium piscinae TaxID=2506424 RepID=A0A4Q1KQG6_9FLAO|nr:hypothetical protein [Flavobacterium piscinae]MBC8882754.1 hypothetical protein [Flavobacterium piscinae]RXR32247.1 hypothetical protein EQG68_08385 [Flavobacterium piscinae]